MNRKALLLSFGCLLAAVTLFVLVKRNRTIRAPVSDNNAGSQEGGWARFAQWRATEAHLEQISTNNPAFQKWGREFALRVVNNHLRSVPLFGLKKAPLTDEDVVVVSILTQAGAQLWLSTKDRQYSFCYENGVLCSAKALNAEMTGLFRDPTKFEHFGDYAGWWSNEEAGRTAEALVRAKGIDLKGAGAVRGPVVRPETFNPPMPDGSVRKRTAFYTVSWMDGDGDAVMEIRFRHSESGTWEPTLWDDNTRKTTDAESTSYTNLYQRFFANTRS